jgi:NTP pyrophosphatase (non-canonical NTP hydrolase)
MTKMTLDKYQQAAGHTSMKFESELEAIKYLTLGISGEAGEVADEVKKLLYHGHQPSGKLEKELGDVLWYVARLADVLGFKLSEIAEMNIEKLASRYPEGFSKKASRERV